MKKFPAVVFILMCHFAYPQIAFKRNLAIPVVKGDTMDLAWAGGLNFPMFSQIDLNADNIPDLFVSDRHNNRLLTFINKGSGGSHCWVYSPEYAEQFPDISGWAILYDYNCDGKPDLFTPNSYNNGIAQYRNDSQGSNLAFTLVDSTMYYWSMSFPVNIFASAFLVPDLDDIDGDGDMDVLGQQNFCVGGFAYYKNMSMEHYGVCDSLNDYTYVTNVWGDFTLRSGAYPIVNVGNYNVVCFDGSGNDSGYEVARRDDTYASIFTIDIDGDGDKDALIGDSQAHNSLLVVNGGSPSSAHMVPPQDSLFPSYDTPVNIESFVTHAYVDADNDGVKDLVASSRSYENSRGISFYKNTGTNITPVFNYIENDFLQNEMIDVGESATPVLFDYDADGVKDLVIGNKLKTLTPPLSETSLSLYRNTGTVSSPAFEFVTDDYAGLKSLSLPGQVFPSFGDIDNDGDNDMIIGLDNGRLGYLQNTAGPGNPATFTAPVFNYMNIRMGQASTPQLFDLDQDGLLDLIIGNKNGLIRYFHNIGTVNSPYFDSTATKDTLGGINVQTPLSPDGYAVPFAFKQGNEIRLLVSCLKGNVYLFGNINGNLNGTFTMLDTVISKGGGTRFSAYNLAVSGGDLNNDSLSDMLLGYYGGGVQIYFQDTSTSTVGEILPKEKINFYHDPVSGLLVVKTSIISSNCTYTLFDITGRLLFSKRAAGDYAIFDLSGISSGVYWMRIVSGNRFATGKLVVER